MQAWFCLQAKQGERSDDVAATRTQCFRDIDAAGKMQHADSEVAQCCCRSGCRTFSDLGSVLTVNNISNPMQTVLDLPVAPDECCKTARVCLRSREARNVVAGLSRAELIVEPCYFPVNLNDLGCMRKQAFWRVSGTGSAVYDTAVSSGRLFVRS